MKTVEEERFGELMFWSELEEVDVDVALDGYRGSGVVFDDFLQGVVEVLCEEWVVVWSSVFVNDGVNWVSFSVGGVDLSDDCCCLGSAVVEVADVEVFLVVDGEAMFMLVGVAFDWVAVLVDIIRKLIF